MFTNGTGTGKTFTGLGIIKRLWDQGKRNILVVAPSQAIMDGWMKSAKVLGLTISPLENTRDPGEGIGATTYANFYQNRALIMRDWDLLVLDESHKTGSNQAGMDTQVSAMMRALTGHERGRHLYAQMMEPDLWDQIEEVTKAEKAAMKSRQYEEARKLGVQREQLVRQFHDRQQIHNANRAALWESKDARVLFLSATPFASEKNTTYAEGFLFEFPEESEKTMGGWSHNTGRDLFFIQHFGWRKRNGKLTQPGPEVDRSLLQRQFNAWLRQLGSLRARRLDVPFDYSREFVAVNDLIGNEIDKAIAFLNDNARRKDDIGEGFAKLVGEFEENWQFHQKVRILEAIKAKHALERVRRHLALGRKVVVFHSLIQGGSDNPFVFAKSMGEDPRNKAIDLFNKAFPELPRKVGQLPNPLEMFAKELGDRVTFMNGTIPQKRRMKGINAFNRDGSGTDVIVVQNEAGKEGVSLHDTTGKHQRVIVNIGLPFSPITAIQQEGRIYRVGQASDAIFEYFNTGTLFERYTYASKIAGRVGETENLSLGEEARRLRDAFVESFENPTSEDPGPHQGKGGKESDARDDADVTEFDKARTYYFAQEKLKGRRDQRAGRDYFPTPEPLGYKLVEWAQARPGEAMLEPSAGHGAIARFFSETTKNTYVEPSTELASRLALVGNGTLREVDFLAMDVGANKADAIVMNPPYGQGGKEAFEHLTKAARHLNDGGRLIAIVPAGPAADARLQKILDDTEKDSPWRHLYLRANILLPQVVFERAGTGVRTRVLIFDKQEDKARAARLMERSPDEIQADTIADFFERIRDYGAPDRLVPVEETARAVELGEQDPITRAKLEVVNVGAGRRPWLVRGRGTYENRQLLRALGAQFDHATKAWAYAEDPTEKLREALQKAQVQEEGVEYGVDEDTPDQLPLPNLDLFDDAWEASFRPEATEVDRAIAREAIVDLVESARRRPSLIASALPRDFVEQGVVSLVGQTIASPEDLATLAQVYRDPRFETLRYVFVKGDVVVGMTGVSSRMAGHSAGYVGADVDAYIDDLKSRMAALEADGLWLLHNHPSGSSVPSKTDELFTASIHGEFGNVRGHVVIDHNNYSVIDRAGNSTTVTKEFPHRYDMTVVERPHPLLGRILRGPEMVAAAARDVVHRAGYVVLIGQGGRSTGVSGIMEIPVELLDKDQALRLTATVRRFSRHTRSQQIFLVGAPLAIDSTVHTPGLSGFYNGLFTDVIDVSGRSFLYVGFSQHPGREMGRATKLGGVAVEERRVRFKRTVAQLLDDARQGEQWKDWYSRHEAGLWALFGENAPIFARVLAATSQRQSVKGNVTAALRAYRQLMLGLPFEGYLVGVVRNLERIRGDVGSSLSGQKVTEFDKAMLGDEGAIAVDRHVARLLFGVEAPTPAQVAAAKRRIRQMAETLGWTPREVQAAIWGISILRQGKRPVDYQEVLNEREAEIREPGAEIVRRRGRSDLAGNDPAFGVAERIPAYRVRQRRPGPPELDSLRQKAGLGDTSVPLYTRIRSFLSQGWAGVKEWMEYQRDLFAEGVADRFRGLARLERTLGGLPAGQSPYIAARLTTGLASVMRAVLLHGAPEWSGGIIQKKAGTRGLIDLLEPVQHELDDWIAWMVATRAQRLMGEGRERLFTDEEIAAGLALAQGREQRFQDVAEQFAEFKRAILDLAEEAGLINPDTRPAWDLSDWIPFYRVIEDGGAKGPKNRGGVTWQSSGIRTLRGGESRLQDPLENIVMNFAHLVDASLKNHAARLARDEFASLDVLEKLTPAERMEKALVPLSEVKRAMRDLQIPTAGIPAAVFDGIRRMWSFKTPTDPDVVRIMEEGKAEYYRVLDPMLLRALTGLNEQPFGGIMRPLRFFKRLLTATVTADPAFMARNWIRDAVHAWIINQDKMRLGVDSVRGLVRTLRETGGGEDMLFAGASFQGGYLNANDPGEVARTIRAALRKRGWSAASIDELLATVVDSPARLWEAYRGIGDAIENASREATYEAALKAGKSLATAAYEAKDLMDYSLRGRWVAIRVLTDMVPFTNARIQGLYKLGRSGALPGPKMRARMAARGAMVAIASVLLMLLNDDDERYRQLEDWDRDNFWHFWVGDEHFRIPKPFELGLLYGTLPERLWRWANEDDTTKELLKRVLINALETLSLNPVPQAVMPALELALNRDTFTQRPIESMGDQGKPPALRYNASTSDTARVLGDALGASPKQIEHLVRGYFGTLGMYALSVSDAAVRRLEGAPPRPALRADEIPVLGSFYRGSAPPKHTRDVTDFYDMLREVDLLQKEVGLREEGGDQARADEILTKRSSVLANRDYLGTVQERFREIRREIDGIIKDRELSPADKRAQIDALYEERNALAREAAAAQRGARQEDARRSAQ